MTDSPRYRPSRGVVGFAASVEQLAEDDERPAEPAAHERPEAGTGPPEADAEPSEADGALPASPWRQRVRPVAVAALAAVATMILGYTVLGLVGRAPDGHEPPEAIGLPPDRGATASALPEPSGDADLTGGNDPTGAGGRQPAGQPGPGVPESARASSPPAGGGPPPGPQPGPAYLTAQYTVRENTGPLGVIGYSGRVIITNPGSRAADGWRVTLRLPVGQRVHTATGATYAHDGQVVTFTPTTATRKVPGGGDVEFTFDVLSVLADRAGDCTIDGRPCD